MFKDASAFSRTLCGAAWVQSTADNRTGMFAGAGANARVAGQSCTFADSAELKADMLGLEFRIRQDDNQVGTNLV